MPERRCVFVCGAVLENVNIRRLTISCAKHSSDINITPTEKYFGILYRILFGLLFGIMN
jgi:hypothetical protein